MNDKWVTKCNNLAVYTEPTYLWLGDFVTYQLRWADDYVYEIIKVYVENLHFWRKLVYISGFMSEWCKA